MGGLCLSQVQALVCELCGEMVEDGTVVETALMAKLFGAERYGVCPCCGQPAGSRARSKRWQAKVEGFLERREAT